MWLVQKPWGFKNASLEQITEVRLFLLLQVTQVRFQMVERYSILTRGENVIKQKEMGKVAKGYLQADPFQ